jgi:hypothetical protein
MRALLPLCALLALAPAISTAQTSTDAALRPDAHEVHRAIERRFPGVLHITVRFDEMSRDEYDELCYAIESEIARSRVLALKLEV